MKITRILFIVFYIASLSLFSGCKQLEITSNGETHYSIVTGDNAVDSELKAAAVLQDYLKRITGVKLEIVTEKDVADCNVIYVGKTVFAKNQEIDFDGLKDNGYAFKTVGKDFIIAGGKDKGTLYGVYSFLQELGCRKYTSKATYTPRKEKLIINIKDLVYVPKIKFREVLYTDAYDPEFFDWHKLDAHRKSWGSWCHTFNVLVPPSEYAKTHPEYYALVNGKRQSGTQLCLSNPEVLQIVIENLKKEMDKHPEINCWSVSQNDNTNYCTCDKCRELDKKEGSPTASIINFVNKVAKHFPNKTISTLAYQYSRSVPKNIKPVSNVNIMLCNIESERHLPISITDPAFSDDLRNWGAITNNIIVWDYIIQFKNLISPFPNLYTIKPNINFLVDNNVTSLFEQGNREIGGEMAELRTFLTARLMWNPDLDDNVIIHEFLDGYYGAAGHFIEEYVDLMHKQLAKSGQVLGIFGNPVQAKNTYLSQENMTAYNNLFDRAEASVKNDSELLERVQICRLPLMYATLEIARTELNSNRSLYTANDKGSYVPKPEMKNLLNQFVKLCNKQGVTRIKEWSTTPDEYRASYSRLFDKIDPDMLSLNKKVIALTQPSKKYAPKGVSVLTDGLFGSYDFAVNWVGYEGQHADFIVDLGEVKEISSISMDFLHAVNDWIFLPQYVEYSISKDGNSYSDPIKITNPNPVDKKGIFIESFNAKFKKQQARFIKVHGHSLVNCPSWHMGAGGPVWIFADEIIVK